MTTFDVTLLIPATIATNCNIWWKNPRGATSAPWAFVRVLPFGRFNVIANQGSGGKDVHGNTAGGDLLCLDNVPVPASGGNSDGRPQDHPQEQCQG